MTEASGASRPAPPRRMLYERMRTLFIDERQERLVEQSSTKLDHDVTRGLNVDGPSCHHHQRFTKRNQRRRNVRVVIGHWPRVHSRDEEARRFEQRHRFVADEREIKIARAGTVRVEWGTVLPPRSGDGAPAQHDGCSVGDLFANQATELIESLLIASERETQYVGAFLRLGEPALKVVRRVIGRQLGIAPMFCVSSGTMAFIITDPCIGTKDAAC